MRKARRIKEKKMRKSALLLAISAILLAGCETGQGVDTTPSMSAINGGLDGDGVPNKYDNCPATANAPDDDMGFALSCSVAVDCLDAQDSTKLANGQPVPVITNPWDEVSWLARVFCVNDACVIQADNDLDGAGDACDEDDDNDGIPDDEDTCPATSDVLQVDTDDDGQGNECDTDDDNDGVLDVPDNCPLVSNVTQTDTDGDGEGDACEDDKDGDGVLDVSDNCPLVVNPDQTDTDSDDEGDVCDTDDDGDSDPDVSDCAPLDPTIYTGKVEVCDGVDDNCSGTTDEGFTDSDSDGSADCVDTDDDNDTILDVQDNCPLIPNTDQVNLDGDGLGDVCDDDMDGDGVDNAVDNCFEHANPAQSDVDGDNMGDVCDPDCDGDGFSELGPDYDNWSGRLPRGVNNTCDPDVDGDGYVTPDDCVEGNGAIYPGAPELCDGADNDCDGETDEEPADWGCQPGESCVDAQCTAPQCSQDSDCDDADVCTADACTDGACSNTAIPNCCVTDQDCTGAQEACVDNLCVCQPNCAGFECGDDGCGGSCGTCTGAQECQAGQCVLTGECQSDADCQPGEYCAGGTCADGADAHGSTPYGASGADGGPDADSTPDSWDDDGDGFCEVAPCLGSLDPSLAVGDLLAGDCDDNPGDGAPITIDTFQTDGSYWNHPGAQEWCEAAPGYDNDCDGTPNDGC